MLIVEFDEPPSWSLDASETGKSTKCPWVVAVMLKACPPTGILYSLQFRSYQETKMAARRTQRTTPTISRKTMIGDCEQSSCLWKDSSRS